VSITAGDRVVLEYVVKVVSVMEKSTETFVDRRNVKKPQASLNKKTRHSPAAFPETERKDSQF